MGIKEALEYVVKLADPATFVFDGERYSDKPLHRINYNPKAKTITLTTLSSFVDYLKSDFDFSTKTTNAAACQRFIIHVESPTSVVMYSTLDKDRSRETLVEVKANVPCFQFERYVDHESFIVGVQSKFVDDPIENGNLLSDKQLLLKFAGTVESGTVTEYGDDGVSQKATIKTGLASKGEAIVPNPVYLRPYRTFLEVEQPKSGFVFRMKSDKYSNGVQCALFEADGGIWQLAAVESVRCYLVEQLKDYHNFVIIS